jgi:hypothetical protein
LSDDIKDCKDTDCSVLQSAVDIRKKNGLDIKCTKLRNKHRGVGYEPTMMGLIQNNPLMTIFADCYVRYLRPDQGKRGF